MQCAVSVENCPVPILVLGGSRYSSDAEALALIHGVVAAGAAGVSSVEMYFRLTTCSHSSRMLAQP